MTCLEVRHRLLTADLAVLAGESDGALRAHLDGCAACAAEASRIIGETARLRAGLQARQRRPEIRRVRDRRLAMSLLPVALAAGLTLVAVLSEEGRAGDLRPVLDDSVASRRTVADLTIVQMVADSGDSEAVIATTNPRITVVWLKRDSL